MNRSDINCVAQVPVRFHVFMWIWTLGLTAFWVAAVVVVARDALTAEGDGVRTALVGFIALTVTSPLPLTALAFLLFRFRGRYGVVTRGEADAIEIGIQKYIGLRPLGDPTWYGRPDAIVVEAFESGGLILKAPKKEGLVHPLFMDGTGSIELRDIVCELGATGRDAAGTD